MGLLDGLLIAFSGLRKHPMRVFLTILGIVIGIGAVVGVVAIGDGARIMTMEEIQQIGGTNILEISRSQWHRSSRGGVLAQTARQAVRGRWRWNRSEHLEYPDAVALEDRSDLVVQAVAELQEGRADAAFDGSVMDSRLIGTSPGFQRSHNWYVAEGRFFNDIDVENGNLVALIGSQLAEDLFVGFSPIGEKIHAQHFRRRWGDSFDIALTVIGIMEPKGDTGATEGWDTSMIMPLITFQERVSGNKRIERIRAEVVDVELIDQAVIEVKDILSRQHPGDNEYEIWMATEELATADKVGMIMKLMLGGIASIALLVAGIGIMNIMLISVTERTKEIGLRKAIGAKRRDILLQFLVESAALSLGGGILGIFFGIFLGHTTASFISKMVWENTQWPVIFSPFAAVIAFIVAMAVGIFFGLYPAQKAARLTPVEALRRE